MIGVGGVMNKFSCNFLDRCLLCDDNSINTIDTFFLFLHPPSSVFSKFLQMSSKLSWSVCPPINFWTCPRSPSSGLLTRLSRSATPSWRQAPHWSSEKPRRSSGSYSLWANAAPNSLTSAYPEKGNPVSKTFCLLINLPFCKSIAVTEIKKSRQ